MSRSTSKVRSEKSRAASVLPPPPSPAHHDDSTSTVPGCLSKSEWIDMVAQEEGEEVVAEILDELMCSVMNRCYQIYLQSQLIPFTVSWARHSLVQTLEWQFLVQDEGEGHESAPFWEQDSEPQPCDIDSWAQGCIPVVHSRRTRKNIHLQRSLELPVTDAVNPGSSQAKNESQSGMNEDHSVRNSCEENLNYCQGPAGIKTRMLVACPPSKREDKKKHRLTHCSPTQAPQKENSSCISRGPISHSVSMEECPISKAQTIYVSKSKCAQKHPDLTAAKRFDRARLVRHQTQPGFEILESNAPHLPIGKSIFPPIQNKKQDKHNMKQLTAIKPQANSQMPHKVHIRGSVDGAHWVTFGKGNIQDMGQSQGSRSLSAGLLLDTMVLSPGVTFKDRRRVHTNTYKRCLSQAGQRANLEPIRNSLPAPLFSMDQLMSG